MADPDLKTAWEDFLRARDRIAFMPLNTSSPDVPHSVVVSNAYYSPWFKDAEFMATFDQVRQSTLVEMPCLYELWDLLGQLAHLDGDVLEIGTWRGGSGCVLATKARQLQLKAQVFLCDTFAGVVHASERDSVYRGGEHADASEGDVRALASRLGLDNISILRGIFPQDTGASIADHGFRLCHIDVDTYVSAWDAAEWVWPRLAVGGVVVFDDCGSLNCPGIARCVQALTGRRDRVVVYNGNGHALMVKTG